MKTKNASVPTKMVGIMIFAVLGTACSGLLYFQTASRFVFYMCFAFGVVAAHFFIMFLSAPTVYMIFRKKFRYDSAWFQQKRCEEGIYRKLKVKKWKTLVPAYDNSEYSLSQHTLEEIIMNMCHAEVVHEVIMVASYLPVLLGRFISHYGLLVVTSFVFSSFHLVFVIVQRYNRPRIIRLYEMQKKNTH